MMIETAYKKMKSGNPLTPDETAALYEYSKIMKDLSQTKASIKGNEALMQNKQANVLKDFLKEEKNANFVQVQPVNSVQDMQSIPSFDEKYRLGNTIKIIYSVKYPFIKKPLDQ